MPIKLGLQPWNQVYTWPEALAAARRAESLQYDSLWTWEHAYACMGDPLQDTFDSYTLLAAWSPPQQLWCLDQTNGGSAS